jgi:hypothetical protein
LNIFAHYLIEDRQTGKRMSITGWSYLWAGMFGPLYVVSKGGRGAFNILKTFALSFGLAVILVGVVGATSYIAALQQVIVVAVALLGVLLVQSVKTVEILRTTYRQRGWRVRLAD